MSATARRPCVNCGTAGAERYCPHCGQRQRSRLHTRQLFGDALDQIFSLESRLGRTVVELTKNPGRVARAYVAGRRARYVNPFKYCLAMIAGYLLLGVALGVDPSETINVSLTQGGEVPDWTVDAQAFVRRNLNNVLFFALPLFAAVLRMLYRKAGFNYAETYAFVLFVIGHVFLVGLLLTPLGMAFPQAAIAIRLTFHFVFFVWAATVFYQQVTVFGVLRAMLAHVFYVLSVIPVGVAFVFFYVLMFAP